MLLLKPETLKFCSYSGPSVAHKLNAGPSLNRTDVSRIERLMVEQLCDVSSDWIFS